MKKLLQINTVGNSGSTGRIAEQIGIASMRHRWKSYIACGQRIMPSASQIIQVGSLWHRYPNIAWSRLFNSDSPIALSATKKLIDDIKRINPDVIQLHNLHGYYLHSFALLDFLGKYNKPVVWTLHDCWPLTGHCCYFDLIACNKWQTKCEHCPQIRNYPSSYFCDKSREAHSKKTELISRIKNLTIVPVSEWLEGLVKKSKISKAKTCVIHNGINLKDFTQSNNINSEDKKILLFVSSKWDSRKGFSFIEKIANLCGNTYQCTVVGVNDAQKKYLQSLGICGIKRTESLKDLCSLYSSASVFVNPTMEDNLPTVNIEALACGTPVVAFDSGGTRETISDPKVGSVVLRGDVDALVAEIKRFSALDKMAVSVLCRSFVEANFDANLAFEKYYNLYESLM